MPDQQEPVCQEPGCGAHIQYTPHGWRHYAEHGEPMIWHEPRPPQSPQEGSSEAFRAGFKAGQQEERDRVAALEQQVYRLQAALRLVRDLDRCEHGRHEPDYCDQCGGKSHGNLLADVNAGYTIDGQAITVGELRARTLEEAAAAMREVKP